MKSYKRNMDAILFNAPFYRKKNKISKNSLKGIDKSEIKYYHAQHDDA